MKCIVQDEPPLWRFQFNPIEALIVTDSLRQLAAHYRVKPEDLPPALQAYWEGRISVAAEKAEELAEAQRQLSEERQVWRGERLALVERWLEGYASVTTEKPWEIHLTRDEMEQFMMVINDRRLTLAAEYEIDDGMMQLNWATLENVELRRALEEIDLMGRLIGLCLYSLGVDEPDEIEETES